MIVHDVKPYSEIQLNEETIHSLTISIERLLRLLKYQFNPNDRLFMNVEISFQNLRYANNLQCSLKTSSLSLKFFKKCIVCILLIVFFLCLQNKMD